MARVIAVQEEQLKTLKENYNKNVQSVSLAQNNANVLSESLGMPNISQPTPIDMEAQSVNLNAFAVQPSSVSVVNNEATNEVFGIQNNETMGVETVSNDTISGMNVDNLNNSGLSNGNSTLPYQEPILNNVPVNVMSDEAFVNYINSLRNMLSDFMNDMNSKLDKLQEEFLSKTGANLVNATEMKSEPISLSSLEAPVNLGAENTVNNIFDADKTFVTNDLVAGVADARAALEQSTPSITL